MKQTLFDLNSGIVALTTLCDGFLTAEAAGTDAHPTDRGDLPDPFRTLLDHTDHMTTTIKRHVGGDVALRILQEHRQGDLYARMILLEHCATGRAVEFGMVRMNLAVIPADARDEILKRECALGDILIRHNVLRRIDPKWFYRFGPRSPFVAHFAERARADAFGRVGIIHCNGQPAIQLLEVVPGAETEA